MTKLLERAHTLIYFDGAWAWGWWCKTCTGSSDAELVGVDHFRTRDGAVRSAGNHEKGVHGE